MEDNMGKKVILISIDGMRADGVQVCGNPYVEELKKEYNEAKEKAEKDKHEKFAFVWNYGKYKDVEDYAIKNIIQAPWAFVLDKKWAERGQMGWWAISDATDDSEDAFKKLFEKIMTDPKYQDYYIGFGLA